MPRRKDCPWPDFPEAWIELPDKWYGEHADRRDSAVEKANEIGLIGTLRDFAVSMALLDNWSLPGLNGNPEKWDFKAVDLPIITWVNTTTLVDFMKNWAIPKNSLSPLPSGLTETMKSEEASGDSTRES